MPTGARALVVAYNQPSGDHSPSDADHRLTRRLAEAGQILQVALLDHLIVGRPDPALHQSDHVSFKEAGLP